MSIEWNDKLQTGVEWLDGQHKELVDKLNELITAMEEGRGRSEVERTLEFLDRYVVDHFGDEEKTMEQFAYPDIDLHKLEHVKFKVRLRSLKSDLYSRNVEIVPKLLKEELAAWLDAHIGDVDQKLGEFLVELDLRPTGLTLG